MSDIFDRRRPGEQQNLVGDLRRRDPDFLSAHYVVVAVAHGLGLELQRIEAGIRLGDAEARLVLPRNEWRQPSLLLLLGAEYDDRMQDENIHMHRRRRGDAAARLRYRLPP